MGSKGTQTEQQALKQNKARALDALLDSATLTEAAEKAGISRKTLYSYIRNDGDFARAYKEAQERLTLERIEDIKAERRKATDVILSLMNDQAQPGAVRLKAAQLILDSTSAAIEKAETITSRNVTANNDPFSLKRRD